jgi:Flp pilus assembly protein TadD
MISGQCPGAVREFETVERQSGISEETTANLAAAYQCNRQPDQALSELRKLVEKRPAAPLYDRIGYIEATRGKVAPALDAFEAALRLNPNDATAYSYRGTAKMVLKDDAGARADLQRALELEPGNSTALKGLAALAERP